MTGKIDITTLYTLQGSNSAISILPSEVAIITQGLSITRTSSSMNNTGTSTHMAPSQLGESSTSERHSPRRRQRGRGRPKDPNQRTHHPDPPKTNFSGRQFGGQLTRLSADAPEFVPGSSLPDRTSRPHTKSRLENPKPSSKAPQLSQSTNPPNQVPKAARRRGSLLRSTAPDITTRTHEDLSKGIYECAICTSELGKNSKIWSCHTCWTVFHISCIRKWSRNEGSAVAQQEAAQQDEMPSPKQWRCPGCNLPKDTQPSSYTCWCTKETDPQSIPGIPPHSCGQSCDRERNFPKSCPHPCDLICHAGPCPPCKLMGPDQSCFCGKESVSRKCVETNYESGWSCGQPCGDLMLCGEHLCQRPCHEGLCGGCEVELDARCYCGKVAKALQCQDREAEQESSRWTGLFNCHQLCARPFDCGEHVCQKECHSQDPNPSHCPRAPDQVKTCPCGKTSLEILTDHPRVNCTDSIPSCDKPCENILRCGHTCKQICHSGNCLPCLLRVPIKCRCGRNTFETICHQGSEELPHCLRICKATLNCGRHECGDRCCTGERKAAERQGTKRKLKPLGSVSRVTDDGIEPEHICTRQCGRLLKCGNHVCPDLCHKGPCGTCREAVFEDVSCNCGRTVLQAPLPCGTKPPPCSFPCLRPTSCSHARVNHNCHSDDESCPPCPYLTEKKCLCGKKTLKNIPCWRSEVLCGLVCDRRLKCGSHTCQKLCHRPGDCEDANTPCQQPCRKPKKTCDHPCEKPCHAPSACKEDKPCPFKVLATCDCQRRKEEVRCNAWSGSPLPSRPILKCDDECARLERNRQLAVALNISDSHTDNHIPYSSETLQGYANLDVKWSHTQEEALRVFAADENERRLRMKPMRPYQRAFIHSLSTDFGFDTESLDPEPHRHVVVLKTPKFVAAPMKTLAQAARIRRANSTLPAATKNDGTESPELLDPKTGDTHPRYNGFVLTQAKFALTVDELGAHLAKAVPTVSFDVTFLIDHDAVALIPSRIRHWETEADLEELLKGVKSPLVAEIAQAKLAASCCLCSFDTRNQSSPVVVFREPRADGLSSMSSSGWSQIASKKAAVSKSVPERAAVGQRPIYTVLGSKLAEAKRKKLEEEELRKRRERELKELSENWDDDLEKESAETE